MDQSLRPDWDTFRPSTSTDWCPACGQVRTPGRSFCGTCTGHMDGAVFRVCRNILHDSSRTVTTKGEDGQKKAEKEVSISKLADLFPVRFALLVGRNADMMRKAGAWFANVTAFRYMLSSPLIDGVESPEDIYKHPVFPQIRDTVYEAVHALHAILKDVDESEIDYEGESEDGIPPPPELKTLRSLFLCRESEKGGARKTLYDIIQDLERRKKLRVSRGDGNCKDCGISISGGQTRCPSCQKASQSMKRLSIASGGGMAKPKPEAPPPKEAERMHIASDD